jgi:hypothetical protein
MALKFRSHLEVPQRYGEVFLNLRSGSNVHIMARCEAVSALGHDKFERVRFGSEADNVPRQQLDLPQREVLTFSFKASRPTAPTTTSSPIT